LRFKIVKVLTFLHKGPQGPYGKLSTQGHSQFNFDGSLSFLNGLYELSIKVLKGGYITSDFFVYHLSAQFLSSFFIAFKNGESGVSFGTVGIEINVLGPRSRAWRLILYLVVYEKVDFQIGKLVKKWLLFRFFFDTANNVSSRSGQLLPDVWD